jgi:TolA-binding protein
LERALNSYTSMEQRLRQDPVAGFDVITQNLNLKSDDGTPITFRDICWHVINQTPEQHQLVQAKNMQAAQHAQIGQLHREISQLATGIKQMQYQATFAQTRTALDRYADAHPRFDELGEAIEREIKLGFTLDQAYARADKLHPAAPAAQTRTPTAQTRTTGKSISGAPAGPANGAGRPQRPVGRREAIASAIKRASGSL